MNLHKNAQFIYYSQECLNITDLYLLKMQPSNIAITSLSQFNVLYRKFLFINILETNKLFICHHSPLYFLKIFHVDRKLVLFETTANLFNI